MDDFVRRSEILEEINDRIANISYTSPYQGEIGLIVDGLERARDTVEYAIAADVVEVVRCSECKHHHDPMRCALWYGTMGDNEYFLEHGNDFYCAFGERRCEE